MDDHQAVLLRNIHEQILKGTFCDLDIVCYDGTTTGSRLVLAALSPYFRAMLYSDMAESRTGVLNLPSISLPVFQSILQMYLCGVNLVNEENVIQILDAAEMMQLDYVKQFINDYLKEGLVLTSENCLNWWRVLKIYNFHELAGKAFRYLTENLTDFVLSENVSRLSETELLDIISKDDLKCKEDDIVRSVMKWILSNNPDEDDVTAIFSKVRLDIVDPQFLIKEVLFSSIVCKNGVVQKMIQRALYHHTRIVATETRFTSKKRDFFILHHTGNSLLSCFTADDKWEDVPAAPADPGRWYSAANLGNKIYVTGGESRRKLCLIYDVVYRTWEIGPDLNFAHYCPCMATVVSSVYTIGGLASNSIEELAEGGKQWQVVGDLGQDRFENLAVTVGVNILVMGGEIQENKSDLIQCFNTRTRAITTMTTALPFRSELLRGSVHLPDVYLLDNDGNVVHLHIIDDDGVIQIRVVSTSKWEPFEYCFGVMYRDGSLLCFSQNGLLKFRFDEGRGEDCSCIKPPRTGDVYNVLTLASRNGLTFS